MKIRKRALFTSCLLIAILLTIYVWGFFKKENQQQVIPFKVLHGLPVVDVNIQGHTLQLILDLGAHFSSLSKESIKKVPLFKLSKTINRMNIYGQKTTNPMFSASQVFMGSYLLPYLEFSESMGSSPDFELEPPKVLTYGSIGREPFLNKVLFIDRKQKVCVVDLAHLNQKIDPRKYFQGEWIEADFNLDQGTGISLCLITNSGEKKEFILDTGANFSAIDKNSLSKLPIDLRNQTENISISLCDGTSLGTFPFYPLNLSEAGLQGILGFDFFDCYLICIDFLNKKIFFVPDKT
ncbi:MAG: retropepsin-like aspartic protease [Candidatus Rhabdochlamydia sp.]